MRADTPRLDSQTLAYMRIFDLLAATYTVSCIHSYDLPKNQAGSGWKLWSTVPRKHSAVLCAWLKTFFVASWQCQWLKLKLTLHTKVLCLRTVIRSSTNARRSVCEHGIYLVGKMVNRVKIGNCTHKWYIHGSDCLNSIRISYLTV